MQFHIVFGDDFGCLIGNSTIKMKLNLYTYITRYRKESQMEPPNEGVPYRALT